MIGFLTLAHEPVRLMHSSVLPEVCGERSATRSVRTGPRQQRGCEMKVLIVGASGLIGSAIAARLASEGHEIVAVARHPPQNRFPSATLVTLDLARATDPNDWTAVLAGIEAVVNCAGVLRGGRATPQQVCTPRVRGAFPRMREAS